MGNDSSKQPTQQQQSADADLRYLRDRLPFDEAELVRLVSIYDHHHDYARSSHPSDSIATWSSSSSSGMLLCQWSSPQHTGVTLPDVVESRSSNSHTTKGQKEEEEPLELGQLLARWNEISCLRSLVPSSHVACCTCHLPHHLPKQTAAAPLLAATTTTTTTTIPHHHHRAANGWKPLRRAGPTAAVDGAAAPRSVPSFNCAPPTAPCCFAIPKISSTGGAARSGRPWRRCCNWPCNWPGPPRRCSAVTHRCHHARRRTTIRPPHPPWTCRQ